MNNFINLEETTLNQLKKPVLFLEISEKCLRILHIYGETIKDFSVYTLLKNWNKCRINIS